MANAKPLRKLVENEVVFREHNMKVLESLKNVQDKKKLKKTFMYFYCECSSAHCMERISISPAQYKKFHEKSKHFIIKPGHDNKNVEKILEKKRGYYVVEKYKQPPSPAKSKLNI